MTEDDETYLKTCELRKRKIMKNFRIYDILTEDGKTLADIQLSLQENFDRSYIFDKLCDFTKENIYSYSYEEVE